MTERFPYDVYVLSEARTGDGVQRFTTDWLHGFVPVAEDYEFPRWSDEPVRVYDSVDELIDVLLERTSEPYGIYWRNGGEGSVTAGMLFFTTDGGMIAGLTVEGDQSEAITHLDRLAKTIGGKYGYLTAEEPPPDTAAEFVELARSARPALVDGLIRS